MKETKMRVYCSGPLFTEKEREEMQAIATALEKAGFETFLPHRDGLEFSLCAQALMELGFSPDKANDLWDKGIFALDAYQVSVACDAVVVNLNGRVPDEGAVAEAAMAWRAGKVMVGYKDDLRSLIMGKDNAMVTGLFDFKIHGGLPGVVKAVKEGLDKKTPTGCKAESDNMWLDLGEKLWAAVQAEEPIEEPIKQAALVLQSFAENKR